MKDDLGYNVKFIELIQERPCLYDYNRSDHSDRTSVDAAWIEISGILKETPADCKERWKNLRGCYTRHLKNSNRPSSSGKRVKPYYLADRLQFLEGFTKQRPPKGILHKLEEVNIKQDTSNDTEDDHLSISSVNDERVGNELRDDYLVPNKISKPNNDSSIDVKQSAPFDSRKIGLRERQDPDLAFLYSVLPDVQDMTREQKRRFKMGVLQLIDDIFQTSP